MKKIEIHNIHASIRVVKTRLVRIAKIVMEQEDIDEFMISLIFVNTNYIVELNRQFLNHDYSTDVLSFPLNESVSPLIGEIYVNLDKVEEQAEDYEVTFDNELQRIVIHGLLHLCGYRDDDESSKRRMTALEDSYLNLYQKCCQS
ncbi:MAG: rRNA maturation RNase YbeY [candidate division KSB1 bacterium]|nr:rRNA maturation RNase YbeY [candidate division KSB1 bacterium]